MYKHYYHMLLFFICSLKMDCEKLVQEKTEMQRHYVMVRLIRFFKPILRMLEIAVSRQAIIASLHLPPKKTEKKKHLSINPLFLLFFLQTIFLLQVDSSIAEWVHKLHSHWQQSPLSSYSFEHTGKNVHFKINLLNSAKKSIFAFSMHFFARCKEKKLLGNYAQT